MISDLHFDIFIMHNHIVALYLNLIIEISRYLRTSIENDGEHNCCYWCTIDLYHSHWNLIESLRKRKG